MDGISSKEQVEFLVKRKFPDTESEDWSLNWSKTLGPILVEELTVSGGDGLSLMENVGSATYRYKQQLEAMSVADLDELFNRKFDENKRELDAKAEELRRVFDHPNDTADLAYWSMIPSWTIDEAAALSLGRSPEGVIWNDVEHDAIFSSIAKKYFRTRKLVVRAVQAGELSDPIRPAEFVTWADQCGLDRSPELVELIKARDTNFRDWKAEYEKLAKEFEDLKEKANGLKQSSEPANAKILSGLKRILLGVALEQYGYDPSKKRGGAAKQIADDCALHHIKIDPETVLKRLREAAEEHQP